MEGVLHFLRRSVADGAVSPLCVVPADPLQGFPLDPGHGFSRAEELDDKGHMDHPHSGRHAGEVRHPELVGRGGGELTIDLVIRSLVKPSRRRAHRRLGPLERTRRVACRVSAAKLRRNRLVGCVVTVILRPLFAKNTDPAFPQLRRVFRGDFFLSTGLIL